MPKGEEVEAVVTGPSHFEAGQRFENLNLFSEKKNGSFLPHLVMPSAAKSEWTEENLPLRLLYWMILHALNAIGLVFSKANLSEIPEQLFQIFSSKK